MKQILDDDFLDQLTKKNKRRRWFYISFFILMIGAIISTVISWLEIETIIGSGPILSVIGILHLIESKKTKERINMIIGAIPFLVSLIWLVAINIYSLGPPDCVTIIPISLTGATIFILIMCIVKYTNLDRGYY